MIYEPAEDSFLIQKYVKQYAHGRVLDMGTGSGILAMTALDKTKDVLAVDIYEPAIDELKKKVSELTAAHEVGKIFNAILSVVEPTADADFIYKVCLEEKVLKAFRDSENDEEEIQYCAQYPIKFRIQRNNLL